MGSEESARCTVEESFDNCSLPDIRSSVPHRQVAVYSRESSIPNNGSHSMGTCVMMNQSQEDEVDVFIGSDGDSSGIRGVSILGIDDTGSDDDEP